MPNISRPTISRIGGWNTTPEMSPASKKFYDGFVAKYKAEPATYFAPLSYSAVYIVADAINRYFGVE